MFPKHSVHSLIMVIRLGSLYFVLKIRPKTVAYYQGSSQLDTVKHDCYRNHHDNKEQSTKIGRPGNCSVRFNFKVNFRHFSNWDKFNPLKVDNSTDKSKEKHYEPGPVFCWNSLLGRFLYSNLFKSAIPRVITKHFWCYFYNEPYVRSNRSQLLNFNGVVKFNPNFEGH